MTMRKRYVATYFYPGFMFPETTSRDIRDVPPWELLAAVVAAQPDDQWFGAQLDEITEEVFSSEEYGETPVMRKRVKVESYIVGTIQHYETLPKTEEFRILRSNIECNDTSGGYGVLTPYGNWQIRSHWGEVINPKAPVLKRTAG